MRSHKFPKPPWHVVDRERGAAAVVGTVGRRWETVDTAVDPERGAAVVVGIVGRRWEAVVGTAVDPERGAAAVGERVGRRWGAVGTAVDPERGAAVVGTVGRRWGAVVGTAVAPPTHWSQWTLGWLCCSSGYNREQQQVIRIGDSLFSFLFFLLSERLTEMFCPERWTI